MVESCHSWHPLSGHFGDHFFCIFFCDVNNFLLRLIQKWFIVFKSCISIIHWRSRVVTNLVGLPASSRKRDNMRPPLFPERGSFFLFSAWLFIIIVVDYLNREWEQRKLKIWLKTKQLSLCKITQDTTMMVHLNRMPLCMRVSSFGQKVPVNW